MLLLLKVSNVEKSQDKWKLLNLTKSTVTVAQRYSLMRGSEKGMKVFTAGKNCNLFKCPSRELNTNFLYKYTQRTKDGSAINNNEVLIHATIWKKFENIMLNKRSQTQKVTYYVIPFI